MVPAVVDVRLIALRGKANGEPDVGLVKEAHSFVEHSLYLTMCLVSVYFKLKSFQTVTQLPLL